MIGVADMVGRLVNAFESPFAVVKCFAAQCMPFSNFTSGGGFEVSASNSARGPIDGGTLS
jgi:hypothetical protein